MHNLLLVRTPNGFHQASMCEMSAVNSWTFSFLRSVKVARIINGLCQDISVGVITWLLAGRSGVWIPVWTKCCFSSLKYPEWFWGPDSLLFDEYRGSFPQIKRPGRETDHLSPSVAEVKNYWSYTSTYPVCLHGVDKENFLFCLSFIVYILQTLHICIHFFYPTFMKWTHNEKVLSICTCLSSSIDFELKSLHESRKLTQEFYLCAQCVGSSCAPEK